MEVLDAIQKRYSCRSYLDKQIEAKQLDVIFEAARLAPSAKNIQDWRFVVVSDKETKIKLAEAANEQRFIIDAAVVIVACSSSDYVMRCGQKIGPIDIAIALDHISLQAADMGLATCWLGSFYPEKVRSVLDIPDGIEIVELMSLGWPAGEEHYTPRLPTKNILCQGKWKF